VHYGAVSAILIHHQMEEGSTGELAVDPHQTCALPADSA